MDLFRDFSLKALATLEVGGTKYGGQSVEVKQGIGRIYMRSASKKRLLLLLGDACLVSIR